MLLFSSHTAAAMSDADAAGATTTVEAVVEHVAPAVEAQLEPAAKKAKVDEPAPGLTELPNYTMNVNEAIDADVRKENLHAIVERPVAALNGLGERATTMFSEMNVTTIRDLGEWSLYKKALAIKTLADVEVEGARASPCILNIDEAVVEAYEAKSFKEILDAPVTALQGVGESAAEALAIHHVDTVRKLADFKYCAWASALLTLSASENTKSAAEKTQETLLKRLE